MAAACLALLAGCGGDDDEGDEAATALPKVARDGRLGYELRYPADWSPAAAIRPGAAAVLRGPGGAECVVSPAGRLPDWRDARARRAYVAERLKAREQQVPAQPFEVAGASVPGAGLRYVDRGRGHLSVVFATAGSGVAIGCSAPEKDFERLDGSTLVPIAASVRLRRDARLERLQPELLEVEGVEGVGVRRARGAVSADVELARAGDVDAIRRVLDRMAAALPGSRIGAQGTTRRDQHRIVVGGWDPRTRRGYLQSTPGGSRAYSP